MLDSLLLLVALGAAPDADCAAESAWNAARAGKPAIAACSSDAYREARRLGEALHQLKQEHAAIDARIATLPAAEHGAQRRRQRQITNDLEAIRGVATTHGWPLDIAPEITP